MEQPSICAKCNEQITDPTCVIAGEKCYHSNHFTCSLCEKPLNTEEYHQENDNFYCVQCYSQNIAPKCASCGLPILENIVQLADGVELHKECFVCFKCQKQLTSEYVQDEESHIVCNECLESSVDKCDICQLPITDCKISTGGKKYHQSCFKCNSCDQVIDQENHLEQDGKIYHAKCLNLKCSYCNESILSGYYKYQDLLYHIECYEKQKQELEGDQEIQNYGNQKQEQPLEETEELKQQENDQEEQRRKQEDEAKEEERKRKQEEDEAEKERRRKQEEEERKQQEKQKELEKEKERQIQVEKEKTLQSQKETQDQQSSSDKPKSNLQEKIKQLESKNVQNKDIQAKQIDTKPSSKPEQPVTNTSVSDKTESTINIVIPYNILSSNPPADIDFTKKELYLSDEEFQKIFQMNKQEFAVLKAWRQKELKQKHKLF